MTAIHNEQPPRRAEIDEIGTPFQIDGRPGFLIYRPHAYGQFVGSTYYVSLKEMI
jgi:hypothetical protein